MEIVLSKIYKFDLKTIDGEDVRQSSQHLTDGFDSSYRTMLFVNDMSKFQCDHCKRTSNTVKKIHDGKYCHLCVLELSPCSKCGKIGMHDNIISTKKYCDKCSMLLDKYKCPNCNKVVKKEKICNCRTVYNYSYKPAPLVRISKNEKINMLFGVEIETGQSSLGINTYSIYQKINNEFKGMFYLKEDSSIAGSEIVSFPFSYRWFQENKQLFQDLFDLLNKNAIEVYSDDRNGFHIHTPKEQWTTMQLYRALETMTNNKELIHIISARRNMSNIMRWAAIIEDKHRQRKIAKDKISDHHRAIAVNKKTVEFRIFRATSSMLRFEATLEFLLALKEYVSYLRKNTTFREYIDKYGGKNLKKWLTIIEPVYKKNKQVFDHNGYNSIVGNNANITIDNSQEPIYNYSFTVDWDDLLESRSNL